ncbi:MAG: Phytyl-phosphate kinase [uncultured Thermomicrobiales bacterium]|uniref:Phytyl-phosphate kinase n=1 Tax=uncultured Thermomicrobiales bacterium TaxID=1645740 RepID=A0A6J4VDW4_9BACT|nr:MAG: Phytyl-phosphate kinase [uncultured Thermomicrobiales bacterium]
MFPIPDVIPGDVTRWIVGFLLAMIVAFAGFRTRSLSASGAITAVATGGLLVGAGGWWSGLLLVAFFVSSSALSRAWPKRITAGTRIRQARGHRRDAVQVLANGAVPVICALAAVSVADPVPWLVAAASAIAGATADTWATEIGRASSSSPRSIVSGRRMAPGTSGAVSGIGTMGSAAGAVMIAVLAAAGAATNVWANVAAPSIFVVVAVAGLAGALLDSVLGATVQGIWRCPACNETSESPRHQCGSAARLVRGIAFVDNDIVNALAIAGAAGAGMLVMSLLR